MPPSSVAFRPASAGRLIHGLGPALAVAAAVLACVSPPETAIPSTSPAAAASGGPTERYVLGVGDRISIVFHDAVELNQDVVVRPDGRISMPLVGEITAAGREPMELQNQIGKAYAGTLRKPEPTVIVRQFNNRVYVGGEVASPGTVEVEGRLTALQAIFEVGGYTKVGKMEMVVVIRFAERAGSFQGDPLFITLNLSDHLEGKAQTDIELKPYDVVYVPKNTIGNLNDFVELYIRNLLPIQPTIGMFVPL